MTDASLLCGPREVGSLDTQINSFSPQGEAENWEVFSTHSVLSKGYDLCHLPAQATISVFPWVANLCLICRSSKTIKTEAIPWKTWGVGCVNQSLSFPGWNLGFWGLFLIIWHYTRGRDSGKRVSQISHWLQWVCFHILLTRRALSVSFWISYEGNFSVNCCWISMFVGARRVQNFPPAFLLSPNCFQVCFLEVLCALGQFKK